MTKPPSSVLRALRWTGGTLMCCGLASMLTGGPLAITAWASIGAFMLAAGIALEPDE